MEENINKKFSPSNTRNKKNQVAAAEKHGVKIGWLLYRCASSKELPHVKQFFKGPIYGHFVNECTNEQQCLQSSGKDAVKQWIEPKAAKCANCGEPHATVYRRCTYYQNTATEEIKNGKTSTEQWYKESNVSAIDLSYLIAEVLSKNLTTFNTMSYSEVDFSILR